VRARLAEALEHAGRTRDATDHYLALARDEPATELALDFRRRAASQLLSGGHLDDGLAVLAGVLEDVGRLRNPKTDAGLLARLVAERARLRLRGLSFEPRAESECDPAELRRVDAVAAAAAGYTRCDFVRGALFATAHAHEIRAAALAFEHRRSEAMEELARSADAFDSLGQTLQAAAARHRRGLLLGGERGAQEVERARQVAFGLRVVNPERMFACYTPGFEP
jgi:hypothetical protein